MRYYCKILLYIALFALMSSTQATEFRYRYNLSQVVPYQWVATDAIYDGWTNKNAFYGCTNWSPSTSSVGKGISFTQTATDCKQDQVRTVHPQRKDARTGITQDIPNSAYVEHKTITVTETRDSVGILENWMNFDPTYTSWVDTNALYGCTSWTPDPSIYTSTTSFTQISATCKTDQTRLRQDREQEITTLEIRDNGTPVAESQTLSAQSASRPYSVLLGEWSVSVAAYGCTNWSPDPLTVGKSIAFTQTASDCKVVQTRTRTESYVDNKSGIKNNIVKPNENKVLISQPNSRSSIGTREDWITTDPVYTAWTNAANILYSCSNWSPTGASVAISGTFNQTSTDCKTDQTRTRQDRQIEQNTQAVRNNGSVVTEAQTINGQAATRKYTVAISAWANNGAVKSCTNWSPDPATVTINQTFTQTATDCLQPQSRTRAESYVDHITATTVAVSSVAQTQSVTATSTQTATGTKQTWVTAPSIYGSWTNTVGKIQYSCTNWTPTGASKTVSGTFSQTATDCSTDQTRTRQDRQQETTTLAYRNNGTVVTESQTLTAQSVTRNYTVSLTAWVNNGAVTSCTNWSPDPSTVTINATFTQTATDCLQPQTRTRAESYVDHITAATVAVSSVAQSQSVIASSTRTSTGTKQTWVATTPIYGAWYNTSGIYGCSNWYPAPSTVTSGQAYTQTATNCSINQARSRQDRLIETTTGAIKNNGAAVTETRSAGGQVAYQTAYGTKVSCSYVDSNTYFAQNVLGKGSIQTTTVWMNGSSLGTVSGFVSSVAINGVTYSKSGGVMKSVGSSSYYTICWQ